MDEVRQMTFAERFVARLGELQRAEKAILKRNAGNTIAESRAAPAIFFRLYGSGPEREEEVFFLVATLSGLNKHSLKGDFGKTMLAVKKAKDDSESIDRRFSILLDSQFGLVDGFRPGGGELAYRLRQCVKLAASEMIGVDWVQLLNDLKWWNHTEKRVQKRWARSYFGSSATTAAENGDGSVAAQATTDGTGNQ